MHNSKIEYKKQIDSIANYNIDALISWIFDLRKIERLISLKLYNLGKTFYNKVNNPRKDDMLWNNLSKKDKEVVALNRASLHNKLLKYEETKVEYTKLLEEFISFLKSKNIKITVIVFPASVEYTNNILPELKAEFQLVLDYLKVNDVKILDLRDYAQEFNDLDYWDADHLNSNGEKKVTNIIKSIIN